MPDDGCRDPDMPRRAGPLAALHMRAGRMAIAVTNLLRPRLSLGARLLALDARGHVFLVRHSYLPGLYLPGGAVEAGESCRDAVIREAREEGALVLDTPPELFHIYWNPALGRRDHVVLYVARGARQAAPRSATLEIVAAGFHPPDRLPEDATPATRARIAEVLERRPPAEVW